MRASFSSFQQYAIAEANIDEVQIGGAGGVVSPYLWVPLRLDISHAAMRPDEGLEIVSLRGKLSTTSGLLSTSSPIHIGSILPQGHHGYKDHLHYLEFPLDSIRIAALERLRAGRDLKLLLDGVLVTKKLHALNQRPPNQPMVEIVWGYVQTCELRLQTELTVTRDVWISRVLPQVGYGVVHVLELPAAPLEACASMDHACKALQQAQEVHKIGLYDEAVGKCRIALEKFFEYEDKTDDDGKTRRVPVLAKSWEMKLGKETYHWLNGSFGILKQAANPAHHSPNAHYSQLDSQMILAITTALVAYAARTLNVDNEK